MPEHLPFGCCLCCRAPLFPDVSTVEDPDTHTMYVVQGVFRKKDADTGVRNDFTKPMNMSHILSRAHSASGVSFWWLWANRGGIPQFSVAGGGAVPNGFTAAKPPRPGETLRLAAVPGRFYVDPRKWDTKGEKTAPYHAWWRGVEALALPRLREFVMRPRTPTMAFQDPNCTYPCCHHCNVGMDYFPRLRDVLTSDGLGTALVPREAIVVVKIKSNTSAVGLYPQADKMEDRSVLSAIIAYFLHRCVRGTDLTNLGGASRQVRMRRVMLIDLFWFCLVILCSCMERVSALDPDLVRYSDHVYRGRINLYLGHLMYSMLQFELGDRVGGFYPFYVFYFLEMWKLGDFWAFKLGDGNDDKELGASNDPAAFVWPPGSNVNGAPEGLLVGMSERIMELYDLYVRPVGCLIAGEPKPASVTDAQWAMMKRFFVTKEEAEGLATVHRTVKSFSPVQTNQAIHPFILNFGVKPVLVPFIRGLSREDEYFAKYIEKWLNWHIGLEMERLASQYTMIGPSRAGSIHMLQHMYDSDERLRSRGLTVEDAAMRWTPQSVGEYYKTYTLCSVWKAACRLRGLRFHMVGDYPTRTLLKKMGTRQTPRMKIKTRGV